MSLKFLQLFRQPLYLDYSISKFPHSFRNFHSSQVLNRQRQVRYPIASWGKKLEDKRTQQHKELLQAIADIKSQHHERTQQHGELLKAIANIKPHQA
ncbi:hypothetical protein FPOAC1_004473 [Fusarium poae]|uniref:hypothetical protein n=1 Tax=Fusarium poae TaxID=36050 RepID=UPI001CEABF39|nr:hypothetical protein FPOAC1_004473 [Fusarium poae]KAG8671230.1 hypothetical protein FPOAC1_004473 [Fusarium poae]